MGKRIVLVGAGSAMFGLGALGDIFKSKPLEGSTVVLHDINEAALDSVRDLAERFISDNGLAYSIEATTSRKEALQGADFCIISIEVGDRYALWEQDWKIPMQYGIPQVYGENGGPGGIFHSLRIVPPILAICEDIADICPDCHVINLSNPMSIICLAIKKRFKDLTVTGVCHEVASLVEHLPKLLDTDLSNLSIKAGGLNHFSILVEAKYKDTGKDAYPDIRKKALDYYENLPERDLFREIVRIYNCLPNTTDSHFGEYIQWAQEVVDHKGILDFYNDYVEECTERKDLYARLKNGTTPEEYWRVVPVMEGIITNSGHEELALNIQNNGLIKCLPDNIIVEVPAIIDAEGVHGMELHAMPKGFEALLRNRVGVLELTTDAILEGSKELVLQALLAEPVVHNLRNTERMLDAILAYQKEYLYYIK